MAMEVNGVTYYTAAEVASEAGVSRQTLWRWRQDGSVPAGWKYQGRRVLFQAAELELVLQQAKRVVGNADRVRDGIYLDNAATTDPTIEVIESMSRALVAGGNASSAHSRGGIARAIVEGARESVAVLAGAATESVVFTSGGTEANNAALMQCIWAESPVRQLVTTSVEHSSILGMSERLSQAGVEVEYLPVQSDGSVSVSALDAIDINSSTLVSVQSVNNETGVIQPIASIVDAVKSRGGIMHVDAAQAFGKMRLQFAESGIDLMTVTSHKIHGPQGVGALLVGESAEFAPLFAGGDQESQRRVGTENVPGIAGFGTAAALRHATLNQFVTQSRSLRDYLERQIVDQVPGACVVGSAAPRVGAISNLHLPGVDGEALIAQLDSDDVYISQTSACTSMHPEPSYVLRAMGMCESEAYECVRLCVGALTTPKDVSVAASRIVARACGILGLNLSMEETA